MKAIFREKNRVVYKTSCCIRFKNNTKNQQIEIEHCFVVVELF